MENKELIVIINEKNSVKLEVDMQIYSYLLDSDNAVEEYLKKLMEIKLIDECDIENVSMYCDGICIKKMELKPTDKSEWGDGITKFLLDKYYEYLPDVGPLKKFRTKKFMWTKISQDIFNVFNIQRTPLQCENRFKTVLKRKKKFIDHNKKTGEEPQTISFESELEKIAEIDDSVQPEIKIGVGRIETKKEIDEERENVDNKPSCSKKIKTEKESLEETLARLQKEKEENRERRHKEKMELLNEIGNKLCRNENCSNDDSLHNEMANNE